MATVSRWIRLALYVLSGIIAVPILAILIIPVIGGIRMRIDAPNGIDEAF